MAHEPVESVSESSRIFRSAPSADDLRADYRRVPINWEITAELLEDFEACGLIMRCDHISRASILQAWSEAIKTRSNDQVLWAAQYQQSRDVARPGSECTGTARASNGEPMETPDAVLPDETLTCCQQTWPTHAAWMEHYRQARGNHF
jgi:hypothetical protein